MLLQADDTSLIPAAFYRGRHLGHPSGPLSAIPANGFIIVHYCYVYLFGFGFFRLKSNDVCLFETNEQGIRSLSVGIFVILPMEVDELEKTGYDGIF